MSQLIKRVAAVHDMSCIGRCSLAVIIPILSCMGIQVCPLPTAVLSTHLGGFTDVAFCDFTDHMPDFFAHWKKESLTFDCIYSGFLASEHQIDVVSGFIDEFSDNSPLVVVDPVMGDDGKLYSVYTSQMQEQMRMLIQKADIITPNYTEAGFLLGNSYQDTVVEEESIKNWLVQLAAFGPSIVIITGIPLTNKRIMNLGYDKDKGCFWQVVNEVIPARYPGTGDIFASVLIGALLQNSSLPVAMKRSADFVAAGLKATFEAGTPTREGLLLEKVLPKLFEW